MGDLRRAPAWAHALCSFVLALVAVIALTGRAHAEGEDDDPPAAGGDDQADQPAAGGAAADDDDKPDQPAAGGAAADDDDKPDQPAAAGDADGDGKPDQPPAAGDADGDGQPDQPAAAGDADGDGQPDQPAAAGDADGDGQPDQPAAAGADDPAIPGDEDSLADDPPGDTDPGPADTSDDTGAFDPADDALEARDDDAADVAVVMDEDGEPYIEADSDGDGVVEPDELAEEQEFDTAFADIPNEVTDDALDARGEDAELMPSLTMEQFRKLVKLAKRKTLERLENKIAKKADARMKKIGMFVMLFSLAGVLLLAMPLFLAKRYPGQTGALFKYSAIAALTFVVTVNLFGGIMLGMRSVQGAVGNQTNPQLRLAAGFFDTLDHNAERYLITGREVFAPTLEALNGKSDDQPAAVLIANGQKVVEKASVFKTVAGWFQKVSFVFGALPIVLLAVTMILFVVAIKPTLFEIIRLPATAAAGTGAAGGVVGRAMRRVGGELLATLCTLGVLLVLTLLAGFVMGRVCEPMLDTLITCFARAIDYLQFVEGASVGKVGLMLFSVILALVFNLAVVILSMSFFLGRTQKIFQQRFNQGVPLSAHARWWKWGVPSVIGALFIPVVYLAIAKIALAAVERKIMASVTDAEKVNWSMLLLLTPALLVVGFVVFLWAARGVKALGFLARYKVKLAAPPPAA
jgi:hypothetical protein